VKLKLKTTIKKFGASTYILVPSKLASAQRYNDGQIVDVEIIVPDVQE